MSTLEQTCCPLCEQDDAEQLYLLSDVAHGTEGRWPLVCCRHCDLLYLNPRPTVDAIMGHYPDDYGPYGVTKAKLFTGWGTYWKKLQQRPRTRAILNARPAGKRLLDLGCSTGLLLQAMRARGWQVTGLEVNPTVAVHARAQGIMVYDQPLEKVALAPMSIDVVTMFDVLEHLHDPSGTLHEIGRVLAEDGLLIAGVPNGASLDRHLFGSWWIGFDAPRHLTVFTPETLTRAIEGAGFQIERLYSFYGRYTFFALSLRSWLRGHLGAGVARTALEWLLFWPCWRWLSYPLFVLVDRLGYGSVITVVARKGTYRA